MRECGCCARGRHKDSCIRHGGGVSEHTELLVSCALERMVEGPSHSLRNQLEDHGTSTWGAIHDRLNAMDVSHVR